MGWDGMGNPRTSLAEGLLFYSIITAALLEVLLLDISLSKKGKGKKKSSSPLVAENKIVLYSIWCRGKSIQKRKRRGNAMTEDGEGRRELC